MSLGWDSGFLDVKPGFYAYIDPDGGWFKSNTGIIDGGDYTVIVDSQYNGERMRRILEWIESRGLPAPRILVNTHHHGDHVWANHIVGSAVKIAHTVTARLVKNSLDVDPGMYKAFFPELDFSGSRYTVPDVAFEGGAARITLPNGVELELIHMGPAHTPGDTLVLAREEGVAYTGDLLFCRVTPFALDGYIDGWIRVLREVLPNLSVDYYIPGHGPICGSSGIGEVAEYLEMVKREAEEAYRKGLKPLEAALRIDLGRYRSWRDPERLVGNLYRAYKELEGGVPAEPIEDIATIALDMIAYRNALEERTLG